MCIDWVSKVRLDKIARCLSVWGQTKTSWDKTAIFLSVWRQKEKNNQRTKLSIYILDTIESDSTTRFKNRSSDRMMTSDWLVDVSDDRYTTSVRGISFASFYDFDISFWKCSYCVVFFSSPCQRQCELLPLLGIRCLSSVNFSHFNILLWNPLAKWIETL